MAQVNTLGDMMCSAYVNLGPFGNLINVAAWLGGAVLIGVGLYHVKEHADSPGNRPLHKAIAFMAGGAALMSLPYVAHCIITTLLSTPGPGGNIACVSGGVVGVGGGGVGLDVLMTNLVGNITGPLISLVSVAAFVMGVLFIVVGLNKASKYGTDPRAHGITNILAYLIIGGLLIAVGQTLDTVMGSLFGIGVADTVDYQTNVGTVLGWVAVQALGGNANFAIAVAAALTFIQLIGILAFVRGLYIVKNSLEGSGQATMAQGFTHIVGGVLAINIYLFLEMMDATFGTGLLV
ncbi:MAG: hypothetical protein AB7H77_00625 [Bdellovibrionales bacterium]